MQVHVLARASSIGDRYEGVATGNLTSEDQGTDYEALGRILSARQFFL